jgi:hypothetical protein
MPQTIGFRAVFADDNNVIVRQLRRQIPDIEERITLEITRRFKDEYAEKLGEYSFLTDKIPKLHDTGLLQQAVDAADIKLHGDTAWIVMPNMKNTDKQARYKSTYWLYQTAWWQKTQYGNAIYPLPIMGDNTIANETMGSITGITAGILNRATH